MLITAYLGQSLDGYISSSTTRAAKFSSKQDIARIRKELNHFDYILMGSATLRAYRSTLTPGSSENPAKQLIFSHSGNLDITSYPRFISQTKNNKPILLTAAPITRVPNRQAWDKVLALPNLTYLPRYFKNKQIACLGGSRLLNDLLKAKLLNSLNVSVSPIVLGSGVPLITCTTGYTLQFAGSHICQPETVIDYNIKYD